MKRNLVFQSDFGLVDGAVSAMHGVSYQVDRTLNISEVTNDITPFNVWEASYRLFQTVAFWPEGTVFVSVVDPGVGSNRKSVVAKLKGDKYVVTPNNGTLTHFKLNDDILALREIDEEVNRLKGSEHSHTFHGRDVYAYTGAKLAAAIIDYKGVGRCLDIEETVCLEINPAKIIKDGEVNGTLDILDVRFGSLWTNIPIEMFKEASIGFSDKLMVRIEHNGRVLYNNIVTYDVSFAKVNIGEAIIYGNSLNYIALAINQGNFAKAYNIGTGYNWNISFRKLDY